VPSDITIGQIVEASIGPVCLVDCLEDPMTCPRAEFCECRIVYSLINERISEVLQEYTLADLLDPSWVRRHDTPTADHLLRPGPVPETEGGRGIPEDDAEVCGLGATKHD